MVNQSNQTATGLHAHSLARCDAGTLRRKPKGRLLNMRLYHVVKWGWGGANTGEDQIKSGFLGHATSLFANCECVCYKDGMVHSLWELVACLWSYDGESKKNDEKAYRDKGPCLDYGLWWWNMFWRSLKELPTLHLILYGVLNFIY